jgi:predicted phage terminase large subunit-like protein
MGEQLEIRPNPGPQEQFLSTAADIAIYGGAAGSGKSFAVAIDPLRHVHRRGFGAVVFRRESTRLIGSGSIWEEASGIYPRLGIGATSRESPVLDWRFPSGAILEFRHLQHEKDKLAHSGKQYAAIYFDELTEFEEGQFWFLVSRNRSTCGIRPYVRATCNPDPDSFVRRLIDWWIDSDGFPIPERSGVVRWFVRDGDALVWGDSREELVARYPDSGPVSLTFIAARLADNPKGDPNYRSKLMALPRVERERLLGGNWNVRPAAGMFFRRTWFEPIDRAPDDIALWVRAWDLAATEESASNASPDWTRGIKVGITSPRHRRDEAGQVTMYRKFVFGDLVSIRGTPGAVESLYTATAQQDGKGVIQLFWQDPGQAGKVQAASIRQQLRDFAVEFVVATKDKQTYAELWSRLAEPDDDETYGAVQVVRADWNAALFAECDSFPDGVHDDIIDAASRAMLRLSVPVQRKPRALRVRGI